MEPMLVPPLRTSKKGVTMKPIRVKMTLFFLGAILGWMTVPSVDVQASCVSGGQRTANCCGTTVYPSEWSMSGDECSQPGFEYYGCGEISNQSCGMENMWDTCECSGCTQSCR